LSKILFPGQFGTPVLFLVVRNTLHPGGDKGKFATPYLLGPLWWDCCFGTVGVPGIKPPYLVTVFSQLAIGAFIGTNINSAGIKKREENFFFTSLGA
jgi:uncharacterized membrane protein AbrB (regulator of aidB expression)